MSIFLQKFESSLEVQRAKTQFSDDLGRNIVGVIYNLLEIRLTTSKTKCDI